MLTEFLLRLFGKQIHHAACRVISDAYNRRIIDSRAMHILAHESGFLCRRPGYDCAALVIQPDGRVTEAHPCDVPRP